jgi:hypothetical protein
VTQDDLALRIAGLRPREASLTAPRNPLDPFPSLVLPDSLCARIPQNRAVLASAPFGSFSFGRPPVLASLSRLCWAVNGSTAANLLGKQSDCGISCGNLGKGVSSRDFSLTARL